MRIALLSDIHGNPFALEAVVKAIKDSVEQIICLGDVALFGPLPSETLAMVHDLQCPVVMGNTDAYALDPRLETSDDPFYEFVHAIDHWSAQQLSDSDRHFVSTFQPTLEVELEAGVRFLGYHGSPTSFNEIVLPTMTDEELSQKLGASTALILAGGHIHQQYVRRWYDKFVLNPGSVGLPYELDETGDERNPAWAEYAVVTVEKRGIGVELRRESYDPRPLLDVVERSDMPFKAKWLAGWRKVFG